MIYRDTKLLKLFVSSMAVTSTPFMIGGAVTQSKYDTLLADKENADVKIKSLSDMNKVSYNRIIEVGVENRRLTKEVTDLKVEKTKLEHKLAKSEKEVYDIKSANKTGVEFFKSGIDADWVNNRLVKKVCAFLEDGRAVSATHCINRPS